MVMVNCSTMSRLLSRLFRELLFFSELNTAAGLKEASTKAG